MTDYQEAHVDAALRTLREHTASLETPRAVEEALLADFAQLHARPPQRWYQKLSLPRWGAGLGLASLAAGVLTVMLVLSVPARLPQQPGASADDTGDFFALDSAERIAMDPAPQLVETEVARTSLAGLGVPLSPDNAGDLVRAQFLIGADGHPLALRLLPALSPLPPDRG